MQEYLEDLWQRLPADLHHPHLELRRRFLAAELTPADVALDIGCGDGTFTAELAAAAARVVGAEVADAAIARARAAHPELNFARVPLSGPLPFADGTFTVVWASEVIEHVADTGAWLSELRRVMTPRGRLLITTPSHGRVRLALGGIERFSEPLGDHLHLYSSRSLDTVLAEFGFIDRTISRAAGPPLLRQLLLARAVRG